MSGFLVNLVRRGAGLGPSLLPRSEPTWSSELEGAAPAQSTSALTAPGQSETPAVAAEPSLGPPGPAGPQPRVLPRDAEPEPVSPTASSAPPAEPSSPAGAGARPEAPPGPAESTPPASRAEARTELPSPRPTGDPAAPRPPSGSAVGVPPPASERSPLSEAAARPGATPPVPPPLAPGVGEAGSITPRPRADRPAGALPARLDVRHPPQPEATAAPRVEVRIGRIEVRVTRPPAPQAPPASPPAERSGGFERYILARRYLDRGWY